MDGVTASLSLVYVQVVLNYYLLLSHTLQTTENVWGLVDGPFSYVTFLLSCAVSSALNCTY